MLNKLANPILVCLIIIAGLITPALAQTSPQDIINKWVNDAKQLDFLAVSHDGISHNSGSATTIISNFKIDVTITPKSIGIKNGETSSESGIPIVYKLHFPKLQFASLKSDENYYSADQIKADVVNLSFSFSGGGETVDSTGTYDEILIENIKWAHLPKVDHDPARPASKFYPLVAALVDMSMSKATIGSINMIQKSRLAKTETTVTYGDMIYGPVNRGNITSLAASGMKMSIKPLPESVSHAVNFSIGPMVVSNYDVGTLVRSLTPNSWAAGDNKERPIIENMSINAISVQSNQATVSIDSVLMENVAIQAGAASFLGSLDQFITRYGSGEQKPDPQSIADLVSFTYGAMRLGNLQITGLRVDAGAEGKGKIGKLQISDFSGDGIGQFTLEGAGFSEKTGGAGSLDLVTFKELTFPSLASLIGLENAIATKNTAAILGAIPTLKEYVARNFSVTIPGKGTVSMAEETMSMGGFIGPLPTSLAVAARGVVIPASLFDAKERKDLAILGYDSIGLSWTFDMGWAEATKILTLNSATILQDGGELNANLEFGGIPRSVFENPVSAPNILPLITFIGGRIDFADDSVVDRALKLAATKQGLEADVFRQQMVGAVPFFLQKLNNPDFIRATTKAVTNLLNNGGSITLSAKPGTPISAIGLAASISAAPGAAVDLLKLQINAQ